MTSLGAPATPRAGLRALAVSLGALTGLAVLTAAWCTVSLGWSWADALDAFVLTNALMGLAFGSCGVLLAWHRPDNAIGWLFLAGGLLQSLAAAAAPWEEVLEEAGAPTAALRLASTVFVYSWPWAIGLCIPLALLLFPDGRPVSPAWRWVVVAVVVTAPLFVLEMGAAPEPVSEGDHIAYLTVAAYDRLDALWTVAELRTLAAYLVALASLVIRYRRGSETARRQLLWLVLAMIVVIAVFAAWGQVAGTPVAVLFCIPLIPVAITVAVVRHRLLDIRLVVSRALAWLLLSLLVVVAYGALVALLDRAVSAYLSRSALATVVLVLLAAPLLPRLQRLVDRAMYGDRSDPARVVSDLGEQLSTSEPGLEGVVASIRRSLRLPWVALSRADGPTAADGERPDLVWSLPLTYGGVPVGELEVGLRAGERRPAVPDQRALGLLAAPLSAAVHATVVSGELQASRERLVGAREEERRRLRRDLHDGLGPALTGIALTADAAANLVDDPVRTGELLHALRADARAALADVRRVVEDLRPPVLDDLGLVGALRQRAEQLSLREDGTTVLVRVDVPPDVPPLPAAVEVAAYRIATEALTNIARHSRADSAVVTLRYDHDLEVSVDDDGPDAGPWSPGTGLHSMSERVAELGGAFQAGPSPSGGRVRACLPLAARMSVLRVVVADDHPVVRAGLSALLDSLPDVEVVGVAADGRAAVREVVVHAPTSPCSTSRCPRWTGGRRSARSARPRPTPPCSCSPCSTTRTRCSPRCGPARAATSSRVPSRTRSTAPSARSRRARRSSRRASPTGCCGTSPHPRRSRTRSPSSPGVSARSSISWPRPCRTPRSPTGSGSPRRPWPTTCPPSSPSSRSPTAPRRSCGRATQGWATRADDRARLATWTSTVPATSPAATTTRSSPPGRRPASSRRRSWSRSTTRASSS